MELRQLRYFLAVAETEHMTRAAAVLGIQQPPLSQQIMALERQLGLTLFHRHPKGMSLTDAGRLFLPEATRLIQDMLALEQRMARIAKGQTGVLSIGFTSSTAAHAFVPRLLRESRRSHPGIALELNEDNAAGIIEAVASNRLHCGFLRVPVSQPEKLKFEKLLNESVVVALASSHPLAQSKSRSGKHALSLLDLRDEPFILVRRSNALGLYANLLTLCRELGFEPRVAAEVEKMLTNLNLVAAGVGISVVPASMQGMQAHSVSYRALAQSNRLDAPITLVYRRDDCVGPTKEFVQLARRIAAEMKA